MPPKKEVPMPQKAAPLLFPWCRTAGAWRP